MKNISSDENRLRDLLAEFLTKDDQFQSAFLQCLPETVTGGEKSGFRIEVNWATDAGGFVDVLLTKLGRAIALELKLEHRENPFQYSSYRKALENAGFREAFVVGIMPRTGLTKGRRGLLNSGICDSVADHRIAWVQLIQMIQRGYPSGASAAFSKRAREISPLVEIPQETFVEKDGLRDVGAIETNSDTLRLFFADFGERIGMVCIPDQPGNSCPFIRFGRREWAEWFGDSDDARVTLMVDIPRKAKLARDVHFHFGVHLWFKTYAHKKWPTRPERVAGAAGILARNGFEVRRNTQGKWGTQHGWLPPYDTGASGFYFGVAFDEPNFVLWRHDAKKLGWERTIDRLAERATRVCGLMDEIASG